MVDPWVALAAVAVATSRIRLGPMVTPIPRRRPWKLARECVTLDHLSGGRLTLGVGLGDPVASEFGAFGEETDARQRAQRMDEGLSERIEIRRRHVMNIPAGRAAVER
jgi:alkanesulfonate monooxygenase SsuD/methylene tetrahydromethanopterin reductase-like flavin-dependent oxidoreductase (luciferase family)